MLPSINKNQSREITCKNLGDSFLNGNTNSFADTEQVEANMTKVRELISEPVLKLAA